LDRKNILSQAQSQSSAEKWDISLKQIDQKIAGKEYSNIAEYQVRYFCIYPIPKKSGPKLVSFFTDTMTVLERR
jgi:hypothetical protein